MMDIKTADSIIDKSLKVLDQEGANEAETALVEQLKAARGFSEKERIGFVEGFAGAIIVEMIRRGEL